MAALQKLKTGKNFEVYTDGKDKFIKLYGRLSYPHFGKIRTNTDEQTGKSRSTWDGMLLMPKDTHQEAHDALKAIIEELKANAVNEKTGKKGVFVEEQNLCLKDGDKKEDEHSQGCWTVNFAEGSRRPTCRLKNGEVMIDETEIDNLFVGGNWAWVMIRPWYFNGKAKNDPKSYPKRVSAGFVGAQFAKEDEKFGKGAIDDTDAWGSVDDGLDGGDDDM